MSYSKNILVLSLYALIRTQEPGWAQSSTSMKAQESLRQQAGNDTLRELRRKEEERRLNEVQSEYNRINTKNRDTSKKQQSKTTGPRFLVKRILVSKSGILIKDEISEILDKYQGKYLNIVELQKIVYDLNRLYRGQKGSLSRALLPPQKIKDGTVRILLIESKMGRIIYENTKLTYPEYLRWVLPIAKDTITNIGDLEDIFTRFNRTHNSVRVSSRLRPGSGYSETDIIIKITEINRWSGGIFLDNEGATEADKIRYGITIQNNSLLGIDDQFMVGSTKSSDHSSAFTSYDFPFTPFGARFRGLYSKSNQHVLNEGFANLEIEGNTTILSGKITQPVIINNTWKVETGVEINQSTSTNMLSIFELKNIAQQYIGKVDISRYDSKGVWITDISLHNSLNREIVNNTHRNREWIKKWTGSLTRYQHLSSQFSLFLKARGQYTSHLALPSSEKFTLGGINNLAYQSGEFSGDLGHAEEIGVQYKTYWERYLPKSMQSSSLKLNISLQHGSVTSYFPDGTRVDEEGVAQSISLGMESHITAHFYWSLNFATPVANDPTLKKKTRNLLFRAKLSF